MTYRLVLALLLLVLAGCTEPPAPNQPAVTPATEAASTAPAFTPAQTTQTPSGNQPVITEATTAVAGTASISGKVVSTTGNEPIRDTVIFLAKVYRDANTGQAAFALDLANSPASFTDSEGNFSFTGIEQGEYVISVGDFYGIKDVVHESNGDARVYNLEPEKYVDAGVVQVRPDVSPGR
jgi:hypothetical protein